MLLGQIDLCIGISIVTSRRTVIGSLTVVDEVTLHVLAGLDICLQLLHLGIIIDPPAVVAALYRDCPAVLCLELPWQSEGIIIISAFPHKSRQSIIVE